MNQEDAAEPSGGSASIAARATRGLHAGNLWSVQVLRGLAALMVVVGHSQSAVAGIVTAAGGTFVRSTIVPWGAGVDLFFVISGFVMVYASRRLFGQAGARRAFVTRRLVRIVPLYWLVTTLFVALLALATWKGGDRFPSAGAIAASYLFLPADTYRDGHLFPVFDLGWTLNYEMFFYAMFTLVVAWPRRRALLALGALLAVLVALGHWIAAPAALLFWTRPILLDFGLGVLVGALVSARIVLPGAWRAALALAAVAALLADPFSLFNGPLGTTVANAWPRVLLAGVPVATLLAAALLGPEPGMPRAAVPLGWLGDASYSLYLLHPFSLILVEKLVQKVPAVGAAPGWLLTTLMIVLALAIALAGYRWVERPMTRRLARLATGQPRRAPVLTTA